MSMEKKEEDLVKQCMLKQTDELEILTSMYGSDELIFSYATTSLKTEQKLCSSFIFRLNVNDLPVEVSFQLPTRYPLMEKPIVFVRTCGNWDDTRCNNALREWLNTRTHNSDAIIMDIILWIQEEGPSFSFSTSDANIETLSDELKSSTLKENVPLKTKISRFYILSHHLYSAKKRANIPSLAREYSLTGFFTPGKPAVIIVEGEHRLLDMFWNELKSWSWQKINIQHIDEDIGEENQKFKGFRELVLASNDSKHVKTGEVKRMFTELGLGDRFNILYNL